MCSRVLSDIYRVCLLLFIVTLSILTSPVDAETPWTGQNEAAAVSPVQSFRIDETPPAGLFDKSLDEGAYLIAPGTGAYFDIVAKGSATTLYRFVDSQAWARSVVRSPNGDLVGRRIENALEIFNAESGRAIRAFPLGSDDAFAFLPGSGNLILNAHGDVRLFEAKTGRLMREFKGEGRDFIACIGFSADGRHAYIGSKIEGISAFDLRGGSVRKEIGPRQHQNVFTTILLMRDGARALYLEGGATAFEIWDVTTGKPLASIPVESNSQLAALSADEAFIALAFSNTDGTKSYVSVREMATNRERASFALKEIVTPAQIAFSLDRRSLAVQDNDGRFAVYDISQWTTN